MANSNEPLTPDWQRAKVLTEVHNAQVDFEKRLRQCHEAVETLLTRTEATHKELRSLKMKLEDMRQLANEMAKERK